MERNRSVITVRSDSSANSVRSCRTSRPIDARLEVLHARLEVLHARLEGMHARLEAVEPLRGTRLHALEMHDQALEPGLRFRVHAER